jgi:hypothetical protein
MVGPCFVIVANVDWITFCKYSSNAFLDYHQVFKATFEFRSPHYSWFVQYMKNNKGDCRIFQIPLGIVYFQYSHFLKNFSNFTLTLCVDKEFTYWVLFTVGLEYCLHLWQAKKKCYLNGSYFRDGNDVILYLIALHW